MYWIIFNFKFGRRVVRKRRFTWFSEVNLGCSEGDLVYVLKLLFEYVTIRKRAPERTRFLPANWTNHKLEHNRVYAINQHDDTCVSLMYRHRLSYTLDRTLTLTLVNTNMYSIMHFWMNTGEKVVSGADSHKTMRNSLECTSYSSCKCAWNTVRCAAVTPHA